MAEDKKDFSIGDEPHDIKDRDSAVSDQGAIRKKAGIGVLLVVCALSLYYIFTKDNGSGEEQIEPKSKNEVVLSEKDVNSSNAKKIENKEEDTIILLPPKLPELPKITELPTPPKPIEIPQPQVVTPAIPQLPKPPSIIEPPKQAISGTSRQNRSTPMLVVSGGGVGSNPGETRTGITITDPTQLLDPTKLEDLRRALQNKQGPITEDSPLNRTSEQQIATYIGNTEYVLAQGKIIDAILETAINTELSAKIRAVVSRDVYSDSGSGRILIPKGSRLIGGYDTNVSFVQGRVNIAWERVILPSGVDVKFEPKYPGVDQLGRAGVGGHVDNRFANLFGTSLLLTSIKVVSGVLVDKIMGKDEVIQTTGTKRKSIKADDSTDEDATKVKGSPGAIIAMNAIKDGSKQISDYVNRYASVNPVIRINQGTRLKVFVNKDIVFPKAALEDSEILN